MMHPSIPVRVAAAVFLLFVLTMVILFGVVAVLYGIGLLS